MALRSLTIDLAANIANFVSDMDKAARVAKQRSERIRNQFDVAMKAVAASALTAGAGLTAMVKKSANVADGIQKMSQRIGASTEFLSQMRLGADLTGVKFNTLTTGLQRMTRRLAEAAATGKGEAVPALKALGVSIESIRNLAPEQQFKVLADAMEGIESQGEKVRIAMKLFDTEGVALLQTMQGGAAAIEGYQKKADSLGLTLSQNAANAAAEFNDQLTIFQYRLQGLTESISQALTPVLTGMLEQINSEEISQGTQKYEGLQNAMITVYGGVLLVGDAFKALGQVIGYTAATAVQSFKTIGSGLDVLRKRVVQGAAEIGGLFSDDLAGFAEFVLEDAKAAEKQLMKMVEGMKQLDVSNLGKDVGAIFEETFQKMEELKIKVSESSKAIKDTKKPVTETGKGFKKFTNDINGTNKELEQLVKNVAKEALEILNDFESVFQSLETPMEALNRQFAEQVQVIGRYMLANQGNAFAQERAAIATERLKNWYKEQSDELDPLIQQTKKFREELEKLGVSSGNIDSITGLFDGFSTGSIGNVFSADFGQGLAALFGDLPGIFENMADDIKDSIGQMTDSFGTFMEDFGNNFNQIMGAVVNSVHAAQAVEERGDDGQSDFDAHRAAASERAAAGDYGPWAQFFAGIEQAIQGLSGGKLFGTPFAQESQTQTFNVNAGGFGGETSTREVRQRSWFRGREWRTIVEDLSLEAQQALESLYIQVAETIAATTNLVGGTLAEAIEGSFVQEFDADGNLVSSISTIMGRTFEESFEEFGQRLLAENIIGVLGSVTDQIEQEITTTTQLFDDFGNVIGQMTNTTTQTVSEASAIAERWRDSAETLLDGANMLTMAVQDMQSGNALLESLTATADIVEELQKVGEGISDAYIRIFDSVGQLETALDMTGQAIDTAREDFIRFATDITDAAGGVDEAARLWNSFFDTFYTEQELAQQALGSATGTRDDLLSGLGLNTDISTEDFRALFESVLPTLSADAIVEWLRAADAIGVVIDAEQRLADSRLALDQILSGITDADLSPFATSLRDIAEQFNENIRVAKKLGATEQELAMIQAYATRQIQAAIRQLEQDITGALADLYGSELDRINEQISLLEQQESQISLVGQANDDRYARELAAIKRIHDFVDSIMLDGSLSPLNPMDRLDEAQRQFDELFAAAQGGDIEAMQALPDLARDLLGLRRDVFASQGYEDFAGNILGMLSSLGVTSQPQGPQNQNQTLISQNQRLIELQEERNRLEAAFDSEARLNAALAIADQIAELVSVTGESFTSLAERLGIPVESFLADLGISLDDLTVETASALAETARLLGVEITELADSVGISLGDLADDQSLLNDALEQTIMSLPSGIADDLDSMLTAIENSTDPAVRENLMRQFVAHIDSLPADQRDLLAPFFDEIDPQTEAQRQIELMETQSSNQQAIRTAIEDLITSQATETRQVASNVHSLTTEQRATNTLLLQVIDTLGATGTTGGSGNYGGPGYTP